MSAQPISDERLAGIEQRFVSGVYGPQFHVHGMDSEHDIIDLLDEIRRLRAVVAERDALLPLADDMARERQWTGVCRCALTVDHFHCAECAAVYRIIDGTEYAWPHDSDCEVGQYLALRAGHQVSS